MVSKSRQIKHRHRRHHAGGNPDNSVCPSLKTKDECVVCKWDAKTSKCGQAQKPGSKKASPKPKPASASASNPKCPSLDKTSCDSNAECLWNDKIGKCRKRTVKKAAATTTKAKPKAKSNKSPVKVKAVSPVKAKSKSPSTSPIEIPKNKEFREMNLEGADFSGMDLTDAFFFACKLKNAKFQNANLTDAKFRLCTLDGANFSGAKIINAEFKSCHVGKSHNQHQASPNPMVCINTVIKSTWIQGSEFANSNFSGTTFEHCDFDECESNGANFSGCKFTQSPTVHALTIMRSCSFRLSNFNNADFRGCDFNSSGDDNFEECAGEEDCGNHFNGCIFTGAKFPEKVNMCSFSDAVLTGSDISDPKKDIQGCYFDATTEAEDVEELKRRAIPPEDDDADDWMSPVKQKTPSPPRVKTPSPIKRAASPVKRAASPVKRAASPVKRAPSPVAVNANPKCIKQTQKKYLERPSPPYSATDCPGMTLPGNDGKVYVSVANAKGVYAWKLQK
jgi:uncharacterized protein YjbI with pentapeptide repeats